MCDIGEERYLVQCKFLYLARHFGKLRFLSGNLFVLLFQYLVLA